MSKLLRVLVLFSFHAILQAYDPSLYLCSICISSAENLKSNIVDIDKLREGCRAQFSYEDCAIFFESGRSGKFISIPSPFQSENDSPRDICRRINLCPAVEDSYNQLTSLSTPNVDIKVSKAVGSRGYNKIRISLVSNVSTSSSIFDYSSQFKYRWTSNILNTGVVTVTPGQKTKIAVTPSLSIDVLIPKEGAGTRGVIIADPCFQSEWIVCAYKDKFAMFNHTLELLNAINGHDDVSFWQILGDNFYDQSGVPTSTWFAGLSMASKSKVFATVPGNHDFWVNAMPTLEVPKDQLGNGFMQFYGQDVLASTNSGASAPYDFSVNPDTAKRGQNLPVASNYFFYNKMGNIGFVGFSGAHTFESTAKYFTEACEWAAADTSMDVLLLLGHWNSEGDGCSDASVPATYKQLTSLPACASVASKIKYFEGHKHCNYVTEKDIGFMVGANGMLDKDCAGSFGIPIVDSTGGTFKVYYFLIADVNGVDNYNAVLSCFKANGVSGCYHLAELWSSTTL